LINQHLKAISKQLLAVHCTAEPRATPIDVLQREHLSQVPMVRTSITFAAAMFTQLCTPYSRHNLVSCAADMWSCEHHNLPALDMQAQNSGPNTFRTCSAPEVLSGVSAAELLNLGKAVNVGPCMHYLP
jgi:hypothetical protein